MLASHDAVLRPTTTGYVEVRTGPVLPDVRFPSGTRRRRRLPRQDRGGVDRGPDRAVRRDRGPARRPAGQGSEDALRDMVVSAALRGAVVGLVPMGLWFLLGKRRRRELGHRLRNPVIHRHRADRGGRAGGLGAVGPEDRTLQSDRDWQTLADWLGGRQRAGRRRGPRGPWRRDDVADAPAGRERRRDLRQEPGVLPAGRGGRGVPRAPRARGGRHGRGPGRRPARQHRHGPRRAGDRRPRRGDCRLRRG